MVKALGSLSNYQIIKLSQLSALPPLYLHYFSPFITLAHLHTYTHTVTLSSPNSIFSAPFKIKKIALQKKIASGCVVQLGLLLSWDEYKYIDGPARANKWNVRPTPKVVSSEREERNAAAATDAACIQGHTLSTSLNSTGSSSWPLMFNKSPRWEKYVLIIRWIKWMDSISVTVRMDWFTKRINVMGLEWKVYYSMNINYSI